MTLHKLNPDRVLVEPRPIGVGVSFQHDLYDLAEAVVKARAIQAFEFATARYPIHRLVCCAARRKLEDVFDDLALNMGLAPQRIDTGSLLLDGPGVFIHAESRRKADCCSCTFSLWADSKARAEEMRESSERLGRYRWVIERTFAWLARFRRLSIRYERLAQMHLALLTLSCALICFRALHGEF